MKLVKKYSIQLFAATLFVIFIPLISKVNFMQNDDWNRTSSVVRFLNYDFTLLPVTATTFYTQGFLGMGFAKIFGVSRLPFLTLFVSVLNFCMFASIVNNFFGFKKFTSIVMGMILFFNPLHIYSSIGFMTENYLLLMMLISLFYFLKFEKNGQQKYMFLADFFAILAFFCKQNGVVIMAAFAVYFLFRKNYKFAILQVLLLFMLLLGYFTVFPQTPEMRDKGLVFDHFSNFNYIYSLSYGILLVSISFLLPFGLQAVISLVKKLITIKKLNYLKILLFFVFFIILLFASQYFFKPGEISWEEYPYFENTFERTGFLPRTVHGTKYYFRGNYDLYKYWNLVSIILLPFVFGALFLKKSKIVNIYSIFIVGYLLLMGFTAVFFDRYILTLLPFTALFIIDVFDIRDTKLFYIPTAVFAAFLVFFSTQLAYDFVYSHNYIWAKSEKLQTLGVVRSDIYASIAWKKLYGLSPNYKYLFSYDSFEKNLELRNDFDLIETKDINYFGSFFVDPKIYLYQRK